MEQLNHVRFKFLEKELKEEIGKHSEPLNLIEIGSGRGEFLRKVSKLGKNRLFTVDPFIEPDMQLSEHRKEKAEEMSFRDNFGHIIYLTNVLEYTDMNKTAAQMMRVLKPGGKLIMILPHHKDIGRAHTINAIQDYEDFLGRYKSRDMSPKDVENLPQKEHYHPFLRIIMDPYLDIASEEKSPQIRAETMERMIATIKMRLDYAKKLRQNTFQSADEIKSFLRRHGFETKKIEVLKEMDNSGGELAKNKYGYGVVAIKKS
ncbi:methyltransferase domain-containing protein [Candidatus Micrarchaeota archaeon]|nr:methyltransferase domain-containing protein [Candidatus Micrarchaeota archaeon]